MNYARFALTTLLVSLTIISSGFASDHDDGENDNKSRSLNLTDLYVFREDKEISGGDANHLVFLMNSNPRSLPQQQYYFSTKARYEIHVSRVGTSKDVPISTDDDIIMRFTFGAPDATGKQAITFATIIDGVTTSKTLDDSSALLTTTPFALAAAPIVSDVTVGSHLIKLFSGLRKDPFFFDVTAYFNFRSTIAANQAVPVAGFAAFPTITPDGMSAFDFTTNYNVNTIAVRVPIAALQTAAAETVFDSWITVSIPQ